MKKPRPPWHGYRRDAERQRQREAYILKRWPDFQARAEHWELSEDCEFAANAPPPDAGDLSEWMKLKLARAYQCRSVIKTGLKQFRLDTEDRKAIDKIAAHFVGVSLEQFRSSEHNKARTLRRYLQHPPLF